MEREEDPPLPRYGQPVVGTQPTTMHSCISKILNVHAPFLIRKNFVQLKRCHHLNIAATSLKISPVVFEFQKMFPLNL